MLLHPGCQILSVFGVWTGNAWRLHSPLITELGEYIAERELLPFISLAYVGKGAPFRWKPDCGNSCVGRFCSRNTTDKIREGTMCTLFSMAMDPFIPFHRLLLLICHGEDRPKHWLQTETGLVEWRRGKRGHWEIIHCGLRDEAVMCHFSLCWWTVVPVLLFPQPLVLQSWF